MDKLYATGKKHFKNLEELLKKYEEEGKTTTVVGVTEEVGCSKGTMQKLLKMLPEDLVSKVLPEYKGNVDFEGRLVEIQKYIDKHGKVETLKQIGKAVGVSETTLRFYISKGYITYTPKRVRKETKVPLDVVRLEKVIRENPKASAREVAEIAEQDERAFRNYYRRKYNGYLKMKESIFKEK